MSEVASRASASASIPARSTRSPTAISTSSRRAARMVDRLVVGRGDECRQGAAVPARGAGRAGAGRAAGRSPRAPAPKIEVRPFDSLLIAFAHEVGANVIVRGLRAVSDFDYEFQMAGMNYRLDPKIETVFLMASEHHQFISSRFVKEIAPLGGDISTFVPPLTLRTHAGAGRRADRSFRDRPTQWERPPDAPPRLASAATAALSATAYDRSDHERRRCSRPREHDLDGPQGRAGGDPVAARTSRPSMSSG